MTEELPGFTVVKMPENPRLVMSVWGGDKTGKTSLGLTFPAPVLDLNLDFGIDELFYTRPELLGKVMKHDLQLNELTEPETWGQLLVDFHTHYLAALVYANDRGGTVMVDTATQLWQVIQAVKVEQVRNARLSKVEARKFVSQAAREEALERAGKPSQMDYSQANAFMGGLMRRALHYPNVNALFINKAKPEYNDAGRPTGALEYHGFGEMPGITQVHVQMYRKGMKHYGRIQRCRFDTSLEGLDIENPTYAVLRGMCLGV